MVSSMLRHWICVDGRLRSGGFGGGKRRSDAGDGMERACTDAGPARRSGFEVPVGEQVGGSAGAAEGGGGGESRASQDGTDLVSEVHGAFSSRVVPVRGD